MAVSWDSYEDQTNCSQLGEIPPTQGACGNDGRCFEHHSLEGITGI